MCTNIKTTDYLVLNTANANLIASTSETVFVFDINNLNYDYDLCTLELVRCVIEDTSTSLISSQIKGLVKLYSNIQTLNVFSNEAGLVGVFERYEYVGDILETKHIPILTKCRPPRGSVKFFLKNSSDVVFADTNVNNISLVFKITYEF